MKRLIVIVSVLLLMLGIVAPLATPVQATFAPPPGFTVATDNNSPGANNAIYTFTLTNLNNTSDFISDIKIQIPHGYNGNTHLLGANRLIGSVNVDGFNLEIRSDGWSNAKVQWVVGLIRLNVGTVSMNFPSNQLILHLNYDYQATVIQAVMNTVSGLFINPREPGTYTWRAWAKGRAPGSTYQQLSPQNVTIGASAMHIESIDLSRSLWWFSTRVQGVVTIHDAMDNPVSGARVKAQWSGIAFGSISGTTDHNGVVSFLSKPLSRRHGTITLTVSDVTKRGYALTNPGTNASIVIP